MPTLETRVDRLRLVYARRAPRPGPLAFDPARLSCGEQVELDDLLARFAPPPGAPWPLDRMTDAQLERCYDLSRKAEGHPPSPAYFGMPHRAPGIGPCRCPGVRTEIDSDRRRSPPRPGGLKETSAMTPKTPWQLRQAVDRTMSDGYAEATAPATRRDRREKLAAAFEPSERQESLIRLRDRDPAGFAALPPATRMGLASYETAKAAALGEG